ncbi:hypothetical protein ACFSOZ_22525 [Mesorhizobium newzealandense]|uniref:Uncharacterized protein n=1 Tax=Mesorhizobium newzealandense TaxID=1300302 RepID=A0ABW4UFF6_9HYPH
MAEKISSFSIHEIVNDRIFLLIANLAISMPRRPSPPKGAAGYRLAMSAAGKIFDGKSFAALPQGQGLHRRR